jgi:hypothetical protein
VGADAGAIFVGLEEIIGADGDEAAIADFDFAMELDEILGLATVFGAETAAAEDQDNGMLSLQFGELPPFRRVVGKLIVWELGPWNNVRTHGNTYIVRTTRNSALPLSMRA